ncbi:hypothetical protein; putative signal peptide [Frankia alni ACN14a]|uniref:Uncharacterized protein n=1 Tax=Frankia alni (strain DSM 45986 / CECT 9034 / ACN14a) TaxID=326424 RepID=Q0RSR4_FRAAA|nr:hypothetical protein; putative signal peptide [Frankia alni ACN14a]
MLKVTFYALCDLSERFVLATSPPRAGPVTSPAPAGGAPPGPARSVRTGDTGMGTWRRS